jgi:hypothetical protein
MNRSTASRRQLFGAGAALIVTAAAAAPSTDGGGDAAFLRLCAGFHTLQGDVDRLSAAIDALPADAPESANDEAWDRLDTACGKWEQAIEAVTAAPALTPEGRKAKARVLQFATEIHRTSDGVLAQHERLALSLVADMIREG